MAGPIYKPRKTASNFVNLDSEDSDVDPNGDALSSTSDATERSGMSYGSGNPCSQLSTNNFGGKKKAKMIPTAKKHNWKQDCASEEMEIFKPMGASLVQSGGSKDEAELFGALITTQALTIKKWQQSYL